MKNTIYADADLAANLLACEEQTGNTIDIVIDCDSSASQAVTITAGEATTTQALTPSARNTVEIPAMLWNFGGDTTVTLTKGGTNAGTITLHFPGAIETDASLNYTAANEYTMQGSAGVQEQIVSLQEAVARASAQTLDFILPAAIDQNSIADGSSNTAETFEFEAAIENVTVAFHTCIQFLAVTTVTASNAYEDLNITVTINVDGAAIATVLHSYRDGRQVLTLNHLVENLSKGNHTLTVDIAAAGGSVSVIQIVAAYLLAAKSTSGGTVSTQAIFENGSWAPGVLADGLDADKMTKTALDLGVENSVIKYAIPATILDPSTNISELSQYFLSQYILCTGAYYLEPFYTVNGYFRKKGERGSGTSQTGQPIGETNAYFWIPIKRITGFRFLKFDGITIQNNGKASNISPDFNEVAIGAGAVVNGAMQSVFSTTRVSVGNWTTYSFDISGLPYIDYIVLYGCDGSPAYKNIVLLRS